MPDLQETEFEVWFCDECVATTFGEGAEEEARRYAMGYEEGNHPFIASIYKVTKTRKCIR